jgi:hypothetical protein
VLPYDVFLKEQRGGPQRNVVLAGEKIPDEVTDMVDS